jgi:predicted metal-binding transcription factor (methanogenesis marker protein 9)
MSEGFSHEDRMDLGAQLIDMMDHYENDEVVQALGDAKQSLERAQTALKDAGCANRLAVQIVISMVLVPFLPQDD